MRMKRVLALQHIWDDPPAYLEELLQEHHIPCDIVDVKHGSLPDFITYQAIILMGGPQHLYADKHLSYLVRERAALLQAIEANIPTLGICLGGQILAQTLGADVRKHHQGELGFFQIPLTEAGRQDPLFAGLPGHQFAFHWHEDVFDLPVGATCLASNQNASNQAFRYGKCVYGLQFHIELNDEVIQTWLNLPEFASEIIQTLNDPEAPARLLQEWVSTFPIYHQHTRILFENFLRIAGLL